MQIQYDLPLAEIVLDFFDQLKSRSRGYASLDYEPIGNRPSDLVKLDVLLAGDKVDALSLIVHRDEASDARAGAGRAPSQDDPAPAVRRPRAGRDRLQRDRPRDGQGRAQGRDREALRRRRHAKRKLLEKQKKGKKRMKQVGAVEVPQEAFLAVLEMDGDA